jgi:hypothetical protein
MTNTDVNTSRRRALAGMARTSLALPVLLSTEMTALAASRDRLDRETDPIFSLIDAYRAATANCEAKFEIVEDIEELAPEGVDLVHEQATLIVGRYEGEPIVCRSPADIEPAFALLAQQERIDRTDEAAMRALGKRVNDAVAKFEARQAAITAGDKWGVENGYDRAGEVANEAANAMTAAEVAILTTPPTTLTGMIAVLDWMDDRAGANFSRTTTDRELDEQADEALGRIYGHLADSLRAIVRCA